MVFYINTYGTSKVNLTDGEIAKKVQELFDLRPYSIETMKVRNPIYQETAAYGHMGRTPYISLIKPLIKERAMN